MLEATCGHHAQRAHRRNHQRLRRGRAEVRAVAGRDRGADGQRHLDHRDHPGRDPPAGAQRRRRQRQPHPHRVGPGHQRRRRDRPGGGLQRAGAARPRARRRAQARLHHPAGEHVAQPCRPEDGRGLRRDARRGWWPRATTCTKCPMEHGVPRARRATRAAARTCSRWACCATSTASTWSWPSSRSAATFGKKSQASSTPT